MRQLIQDQETERNELKLKAHVFNVYQGEYGTAGRVRIAHAVATSVEAVCLMLQKLDLNPDNFDIKSSGRTTRPVSFERTDAVIRPDEGCND